MRNRPLDALARCPTDGVPLLLVVYGGVVMVGCELCERVVSYSPRETFEPPAAPARAAPPVAPPRSYAEAVRAHALGWRPSSAGASPKPDDRETRRGLR